MKNRDFLNRLKNFETNEELVLLLKEIENVEYGARIWNNWRNANPNIKINVVDKNFSGINLSGINLDQVNFVNVIFDSANLELVSLENASIETSSFVDTIAKRIDFLHSFIRNTNFTNCDLSGSAMLCTILDSNNFENANFSDVLVGGTVFANIDLSKIKFLDEADTNGSSHISTSTLASSNGVISPEFLRKCGLKDWEIELARLYKSNLSNDDMVNIINSMSSLR